MTHGIPVLLIAEKSSHEQARLLLGEAASYVRLADPAELYSAILEVIS